MSITEDLERLREERSRLAFESGVRCGVADERCRMLDWVQSQNDHEATRVVTNYLRSKNGDRNGIS